MSDDTSLRHLVDFINHGILPFTGREAEAERIITHWEHGGDLHGLGAILLLGEAGIGKSRLIEEISARIAHLGGAVIHTKLYPESPTAIVPLMARAIARFAAANALLKVEPEENLPSVLAALRRLARLRRTLVIIEDVHLLANSGLSGVMELLNGLADEQIIFLCAARPIELPIRGVLERFLVEEIELEGLSAGELAELVRTILEYDPSPALTSTLLKATAGNPLALRSALRGAIKSGALARDGHTWRLSIPTARFEELLLRNVSLLSEGMAAHLTDAERGAAEQIASLGEVAARETIAAIVDDGSPLIEALIFKGILVSSASGITPLHGPASEETLLAFTHSLLHRRFVENAEVDRDRLLRVIAEGTPLYSIVPFQLLAGHASALTASAETIRAAIDRTLRVAQKLDSTADWRMGLSVWDIGAELFEAIAPGVDDERRRELKAALLNRRLMLLRREDTGEEYRALVDELLKATENPATPAAVERRMQALTHLYRRLVRVEMRARYDDIWSEIGSLCERFPEARYATVYFEYVRDVAHAANMMSDASMLSDVESRLNAILADEALDDENRAMVRRLVYPHLLRSFETREELERRIAILHELELTREVHDIEFLWQACLFDTSTGDLDRAMRRFEITLPKLRERGLLYSYSHAIIQRLFCRASTGMPLDAILTEALAAAPRASERIAESFRTLSATRLGVAGALRGEMAWTDEIIEYYLGERRNALGAVLLIELALAGDAPTDRIIELAEDAPDGRLVRLIRALFIDRADRDACIGLLGSELARPILRVDDLLGARSVIDLAGRADAEHGWDLATALGAAIHASIEEMLRWLEARAMHAFMGPIVDRYGSMLTRAEVARWRSGIAELARTSASAREEKMKIEAKIELTMLGVIEIRRPGEEPLRPRGARLRTLLGLLVADRMLEKPLGPREFPRIAASDAAEIEDARKTLNLAVHRLREMLGHDAIITDGETPRLNLDLVRVDLLRAHHLFIEAEGAIREAAYHRAVGPLAEALDVAAGEVPFPVLYEEFFEAAREEFENRLRLGTIKTARGLLYDGDAMSAEGILRRAFEAMPDDEEIAQLLCTALTQLGKKIEAERVRIRIASEMGT